jgi:hypothetical protein
VISDFHHEADKNCTLLSFSTASCGNFLLTFRDNVSVPPSRSRNAEFAKWPHIDGLLKYLNKLWNKMLWKLICYLVSYAWLLELITVKQKNKEVHLKCGLLQSV